MNSRLIWHKYAEDYFRKASAILEIGPQGYPSYYEKHLDQSGNGKEYICLDIRKDFISGADANPAFILSSDPLKYPIAENRFDIVFSDQVLAHVEFFWLWYAELLRITKPGGLIITINAYSYPRCPSPIDAWRVHSDGMEALNKFYGLETILSKTESAELEKYGIPDRPGYYYPGASIVSAADTPSDINLRVNVMKKYWNAIVGKVPKARAVLMNPVHAAFDTITIARKPLLNT